MKNYKICGDVVALIVGAANLSGYPVVVGHVTGVAAVDGSDTVATAVRREGVFTLSVKGVDGNGNSAVAIGDRLYLVDGDTPKLSKKVSGVLFGYALETVGSGSTATIQVLLVCEGEVVADGAITDAKLALGSGATLLADPGNAGALLVTKNGYTPLVSTGAETRTLAVPTFAGQRRQLAMKTDGGDIVVTSAQAINQTGNNTVTFNDAGDTLLLEAIYVGSALRWRGVVNDGCTLATV